MSTLVVVAQKALARLFTHPAPGAPLEEFETLEHAESAMLEQELVTDGPGSVKERMGPQVRAAQPQQYAKDHEAESFAREVADRIRELRLQGTHDRAVVVAAPQFLGLLRNSLGAPERRFVEHTVAKNVAAQDVEAISAQLHGVLQVEGAPEPATPVLRKEVRHLLS